MNTSEDKAPPTRDSEQTETVTEQEDYVTTAQETASDYSFALEIPSILVKCPICFEELPSEEFLTVSTCSHRSCLTCMKQYLKTEITDARIKITCPECREHFHPNDIRLFIVLHYF